MRADRKVCIMHYAQEKKCLSQWKGVLGSKPLKSIIILHFECENKYNTHKSPVWSTTEDESTLEWEVFRDHWDSCGLKNLRCVSVTSTDTHPIFLPVWVQTVVYCFNNTASAGEHRHKNVIRSFELYNSNHPSKQQWRAYVENKVREGVAVKKVNHLASIVMAANLGG